MAHSQRDKSEDNTIYYILLKSMIMIITANNNEVSDNHFIGKGSEHQMLMEEGMHCM
jgi:hypothetical protein